MEFSAENIAKWLSNEIRKSKPDFIIPIGHRIFNLLYVLDRSSVELRDIFKRVIDINAISYIDFHGKRIMMIDEETEYGRKFVFDAFPRFAGNFPDSVDCSTIFLDNDVDAKETRQDRIKQFGNATTSNRFLADALQKIKSYRSFDNDDEFHSSIFLFRKFIESNLSKPYNSDATIFHLQLKIDRHQLAKKLSKYGFVFSYSDRVFSFVPMSFSPGKPNNLNGIEVIDEAMPKSRFFEVSDHSFLVSPMAYCSIKFNVDFSKTDWISIFRSQILLHRMLTAWKGHIKTKPTDPTFLEKLYDVVVFWMDVELFKNFLYLVRKTGVDLKFEMDNHLGCISHYGDKLGTELADIVRDDLARFSIVETELLDNANYKIDPFSINTDIATQIAIKAACLEQYSSPKEGIPRTGLTFSGIQKRVGLNPISVSICIDILCDSAFLRPFDRLLEDSIVARFYNTDIEEFIGIFVKLLRRAEAKGIPIGKTNLNKFTTFLSYFPLQMMSRVKGQVAVIDAPEGKVVHIMEDEINANEKLEDLLTEFPKYERVFRLDGDQYKIKPDAFRSEHDFRKHMTIMENENVLDAYLDVIFQVYSDLTQYLETHTEIKDSKGRPRTIYDAFPGLIELIGREFPEGGLEIIGSLAKRGLHYYESYTVSNEKDKLDMAEDLLFHSLPHKIEMYKEFSEAYFECYKRLSLPYDSNRGRVWQNMCVFPKESLVLELCSRIITFMQKNLKLDSDRIEAIEEKTEGFLNLLINCSSLREPQISPLPKNTAGKWYIVSVDIKNSTNLSSLYDPRWAKIKTYFRNIMYRWAELYNAALVNTVGDEVFVALPYFELARAFASGTCTHINEVAHSINRCEAFLDNERHNIETRAYGKIVFGTVRVDPYGDCDSSEIDMMCKKLPKVDGKIIVDAQTIPPHDYPGQVEIVTSKELRPYYALEPEQEFRRLILKQFE